MTPVPFNYSSLTAFDSTRKRTWSHVKGPRGGQDPGQGQTEEGETGRSGSLGTASAEGE